MTTTPHAANAAAADPSASRSLADRVVDALDRCAATIPWDVDEISDTLVVVDLMATNGFLEQLEVDAACCVALEALPTGAGMTAAHAVLSAHQPDRDDAPAW